jgi:metal transporter CNNM
MSLPVTILVCLLLLGFGAIFSGLNIGLMMVRPAELKRKAAHGDAVAEKLYHYRKDGTYLIVCVLLGNVAVISTLSLLLESIAGGLIAGVVTTLTVTIFAEIVPQTIFVRKGYKFSRHFFWLLNIIFLLFWPLARPLTIILNRLLGEELPTIFTREEISHLVDEHAKEHSHHSGIDIDESRIVRGALAYGQVEAREVMTPIEEVNDVQADDELDIPLLIRLKKNGHSRFPVLDSGTNEYVGVLYMKDLLAVELPQPVAHLYRDRIFDVPEDAQLDTVLSRFIQTKSHLFLVTSEEEPGEGAEPEEKVVGIITLEDVIEKILNREIADEFDPEE